MKTYFVLLFSVFSFTVLAQNAPVKWATQETFFEDLIGKDLPSFNGLTINKNEELQRNLDEGPLHQGKAEVNQFIGQKL